MRTKSLGLGAASSVGLLFAAVVMGCSDGGSSSGGGASALCDVDFADLAGTYSFSMTTGETRYTNSCFEGAFDPDVDPGTVKDCMWVAEPRKETITVELVVQEDGNIGEAKITSVTEEGGQPQDPNVSVKCEMLKGELCNAPIRCTVSGSQCATSVPPEPTDDWQYPCNCAPGSPNDPTSAPCLACKAEYDKYQSQTDEYCQKQNDSAYYEFTLNIK